VTRRKAPFAGLLSGYAISILGTSMSALAIPWMVLTTTGSAGKTGLVAFAEMTPYVVAQALAGPIVDRIGLRRAFVVGNLVAALAVAAIPATYALGGLSLGALLALVAVAGLVRGASDCANMALVPATAAVGEIPLERAAGLNSGANRTAMLLGAPLAGVLVAWTGPAFVVLLDAVTFALAAIIGAIWVRGDGLDAAVAPDSDAPSEAGMLKQYGRDLAAGLRFLRGDRLLLGIMTMVAVTNLLDQGYSSVMLPVWVRDDLGSPEALGLLGGVFGLGSVLGNLGGAWLGPKLPRRMLYGVGFLLGGAPSFLALSIWHTLPPVIVVFLLCAIFTGSLNSVIGATSYERIPEHLRARVLGVIRASAWAGIPIGALLGGGAVEAFGLSVAVTVFGAVYLVTTLAPFVFPAWREMKRPVDVNIREPEPIAS
jgi:MFS family permease